jgi:hypothetical protein
MRLANAASSMTFLAMREWEGYELIFRERQCRVDVAGETILFVATRQEWQHRSFHIECVAHPIEA